MLLLAGCGGPREPGDVTFMTDNMTTNVWTVHFLVKASNGTVVFDEIYMAGASKTETFDNATFAAGTYQTSFSAQTQFGATRQTMNDGVVMNLGGAGGSLVAILDPAKPTLEFRPPS